MSASFHVEVKSLIEDRVDGLIPLTREGHCLATATNLKLDEANLGVVSTHSGDNATHVVNCMAHWMAFEPRTSRLAVVDAP